MDDLVIEDTDGLKELSDWLFGRVADDNDIVVDKMQDQFANYFEEWELKQPQICAGSEEYQQNILSFKTTIAKLKTPEGAKEMQVKEGKQKITDGIRPCWYGGRTDQNGFPNGEGMLKYENHDTFIGTFDHGVLNREGKLTLTSKGHVTAEGTWRDGLMDGEMNVSTQTGGWIEGYWKFGVPHGFQREFGPKGVGKKLDLKFVGRFYRGLRRGFCWKGLFGDGFLCGFVDPLDGSFSGDDLAYIYPDFKTALRGKFHDERLVSGRLCQLVGSTLEYGIRIPIFTKPDGQVYTFDNPTINCIGKNPMLPDPWEESRAYVHPSLLPQGSEGLFARRPIFQGSIICFFNGIRLNTSTWASQRLGHSDYRIRLNADVDLDIPSGYETTDRYCATLGHKVHF